MQKIKNAEQMDTAQHSLLIFDRFCGQQTELVRAELEQIDLRQQERKAGVQDGKVFQRHCVILPFCYFPGLEKPKADESALCTILFRFLAHRRWSMESLLRESKAAMALFVRENYDTFRKLP